MASCVTAWSADGRVAAAFLFERRVRAVGRATRPASVRCTAGRLAGATAGRVAAPRPKSLNNSTAAAIFKHRFRIMDGILILRIAADYMNRLSHISLLTRKGRVAAILPPHGSSHHWRHGSDLHRHRQAPAGPRGEGDDVQSRQAREHPACGRSRVARRSRQPGRVFLALRRADLGCGDRHDLLQPRAGQRRYPGLRRQVQAFHLLLDGLHLWHQGAAQCVCG